MNTLEAALSWAQRGYHVFPLKPDSKEPATTHGFKDATTSVELIDAWFTTGKNYNLGIRTGKISRVIVLDLDVKGNYDAIKSLTARYGKKFLLPEKALLVKTPSGGLHIPVKWDESIDCGCGVNVLGLEGVDVRGNNGFIVASPSSIKVNGKEEFYRVKDFSLPVTSHYGWITELLSDFKLSKQKTTYDPTDAMVGINSGERNATLFAYARHLFARGFDKGLVSGFVFEAARRCIPPLNQDEASRVIENAFAYQAPEGTSNLPSSNTKPSLEDLI